MEFEDILKDVGDFGTYQKFLVVVFLIPACIIIPWFSMNAIFVSSTPDHWCFVPEVESSNLTVEAQRHLIRPPKDPSCTRYEVNFSQILQSGNWTVDTDWPTTNCDMGWRFDTTNYDETVATKWNLVCEDDSYKSMVTSFVFVGVFIGTPVYGYLSDRYGRKPIFIILAMIVAVSEIASAFNPYFTLFLILRVFIGSTMNSIYGLGYILVLEIVRPDLRARINGIACNFWSVGLCLLPLVAYLTRNWVYLTIVIAVASACFLFYLRILPESPSWLISRDRYEEAAEILIKIAKVNGKSVPENLLQNIQNLGKKKKENSIEKGSPCDLLKYPNLRKRFILIIICWIGISLPYFGVQVNVTNLNGNEFINFFIVSLVEIPSHLITWILLDRLGRKLTAQLGYGLSATSCILQFMVPSDFVGVGIAVSILSKAGISSAFMTHYQLSPELLPTSLRGLGMGLASTIGTGASLLVPYIVQLEKFGSNIPFLIFSLMSLICLICISFLPETRNKNLPQTIDDVENFEKDETCFSFWAMEKYKLDKKKSSLPTENLSALSFPKQMELS